MNRFKNIPLPKVLAKAREGGFEQGRVDGIWVDLGEKAKDKAVDHDVDRASMDLEEPELPGQFGRHVAAVVTPGHDVDLIAHYPALG